MLIIPLIDIFITACDWMSANGTPPSGLVWFVLLSYTNGMLIEIGRKIRSPEDEETGVDTYSRLWGLNKSCNIFLIWIVVSALFAVKLGLLIHFFWPILICSGLFILVTSAIIYHFIRNPVPGKGQSIERLSGYWVLASYLMIGIIPMVLNLSQ